MTEDIAGKGRGEVRPLEGLPALPWDQGMTVQLESWDSWKARSGEDSCKRANPPGGADDSP